MPYATHEMPPWKSVWLAVSQNSSLKRLQGASFEKFSPKWINAPATEILKKSVLLELCHKIFCQESFWGLVLPTVTYNDLYTHIPRPEHCSLGESLRRLLCKFHPQKPAYRSGFTKLVLKTDFQIGTFQVLVYRYIGLFLGGSSFMKLPCKLA